MMKIVCLDLEGVLVPEIWQKAAKSFGLKELTRTTRDEPNYDKLMKFRIDILNKHRLRIKDMNNVIKTMKPLPGACYFLNSLRRNHQVVILSDTFYEFSYPLMKQLGLPTLFCNSLKIDSSGRIRSHQMRQPNGKVKAVKALRRLNIPIVASGDSYNDIGMLKEADKGFLFKSPESIKNEYPEFPATDSHKVLLSWIEKVH